ncbi:DoxX family protein [Candidatus Woesearchaeota archaeon]|nr:DoxX family protein [Candidatus Woesearchaeota archaeon]
MTNLCLKCFDKYKEWAPLALRLVAGFIFIMAGFSKLSGIDGFAGMLSGASFPAAAFFAWLVALVEFLGGILLVIGLMTRWSSALLGVTMIVATIMMLISAGDYKYPLVLLASMIALLFSGGGKLSVDSKLG